MFWYFLCFKCLEWTFLFHRENSPVTQTTPEPSLLTHWGRVTHRCISDLTSIGSDNGFSPGRRQAIIRTNAGILLIRPLGTNFSEFLIEILIFSFKKMRLKESSAKRRPFCLGLNELSLGGWPREKIPPTPEHAAKPGLIEFISPLIPQCSWTLWCHPLILRCATNAKFA